MLEKKVFIDVEEDKHIFEFGLFHGLPDSIDVIIIDISLKAKKRSGKYGLKTMHKVVEECIAYLEINDVILYLRQSIYRPKRFEYFTTGL